MANIAPLLPNDQYGLNDLSLLTGPQQDTAKNIQDAFRNSAAQRDRTLARYPALAQVSTPMLQEFENDQALARARFTAYILNQNQQVQNAIDASHHTPHGVQENLAAYAPWLAGALRAFPALFGQGEGSELSRQGLIPYAANKIGKVFDFQHPNGGTYALDENGKVIGLRDQYGNVVPSYPTTGAQNTLGSSNIPDYTNDLAPPVEPKIPDYLGIGNADFQPAQMPDIQMPDFSIPFEM